jgi:hypothetical protein
MNMHVLKLILNLLDFRNCFTLFNLWIIMSFRLFGLLQKFICSLQTHFYYLNELSFFFKCQYWVCKDFRLTKRDLNHIFLHFLDSTDIIFFIRTTFYFIILWWCSWFFWIIKIIFTFISTKLILFPTYQFIDILVFLFI